MQLQCPHCRRTLEFSGDPLRFCSFCGHPLDQPDIHLATTFPRAASEAPESSRFHPSDEIANYRLIRELGRGGMGVVWEAEETSSGRRLALKLLPPGLPHTEETLQRFLREARLAASLFHPRSTCVFGAGFHDGQPYIAMELMPGRTLKDLIEQNGPLPTARAVDSVLDIIDGLEAAHAAGIIHRDLKPSNCFLDSDGRVKVGDFGISKSLVSDTTLTGTGAFMGTPQFAAPEQLRAAPVDWRTDVYGVGATLFYLLTGRPPFIGDSAAVIAQIASDPAPPLSTLVPNLPADLDHIVARTLEKDPGRRFATLADLRPALLPFATAGTSIADVGRRLAAYMIDTLGLGIVTSLVAMVVGVMLAVRVVTTPSEKPELIAFTSLLLPILQFVLQFVLPVGYFAVAESRWGRTVGKLLTGLRVRTSQGQPAGFPRALGRALFIPGGLGIPLLISLYANPFAFSSTTTFSEGRAVTEVRTSAWYTQAMAFVGFVPTLLCLVTIRARNGYRGVHELLTDTRVVRLRTTPERFRLQNVPCLAPLATADVDQSFGPFQSIGSLGQSGTSDVLVARDSLLGRLVWIHVTPDDAPELADSRTRLARPARPRWLQSGETGELRWNAFEPILGAPLSDLAPLSRGFDWERGRFVLLDLAEELLAAVDDGTLPSPLTLDQVWLDRGGRVKLLDAPLSPPNSNVPRTPAPMASDLDRALALLRAAAGVCSAQQVLPVHAQDFLAALAERPADRETLRWAAETLRDLSQKTARFRWDDRLGVLAVSMGTENPVYSTAAWLYAVATRPFVPLPVQDLWPLTLLLSLSLPALVGFLFRGGPVFRLMGVEVRRRDGRPPSQLRCAWRNLLAWGAWAPFLSFIAVFGSATPETPATAVFGSPMVVGCASCIVFVFFFGAIYAVASPQRGLQDLLAGTRLVPR